MWKFHNNQMKELREVYNSLSSSKQKELQKIVKGFNASNINERILWLKTILEKEKKNKGEIYINGDLNNSRIYFKPFVE